MPEFVHWIDWFYCGCVCVSVFRHTHTHKIDSIYCSSDANVGIPTWRKHTWMNNSMFKHASSASWNEQEPKLGIGTAHIHDSAYISICSPENLDKKFEMIITIDWRNISSDPRNSCAIDMQCFKRAICIYPARIQVHLTRLAGDINMSWHCSSAFVT